MKDERNCHSAVGELSSEQHFINLPPLPLLCEISVALHLAQLGLMAGRQTKYRIISKISKLAVGRNI